MTTRELTYDDLDICIDDIYVQMECKGTPEESVCAEVREMLDDIRRWLRPRFAFTVVRGILNLEEKSLTIGASTFNCGRIVTRQLRGSEAYAIFVCTAGVKYQNLMERLTEEGDMMRLYIAHSIGSVIAERCADYMERILQGTIDKLHWHRTNRFSPGYCGWHVSEQQMLFPLMDGHDTGVTLTPSSLMIPIKSVSGIIGLGTDVRYLEYTCGLCDYKNCYKKASRKAKKEAAKGLYVHIPFCASRCIYCGFYSTVGTNLQEQYIDALIKEYRMQKDQTPFNGEWDTIYLGGGTPSTIPTHLLDRLLEEVTSFIPSKERLDCMEITMECNPDDITPEFAQWLGESPINRVSMGAQTFSDKRLKWLNRRHTATQVDNAVRMLRDYGISNISIDLMFGFPGQNIEEWQQDVDHAIALNPEHISAYSLMYDEDTTLYRMLERGEIHEIGDELSLQMYDMMTDKLKDAGYEHYEISNFAKPGFRSRHNSSYWQQVPYLGIGAAAHSFNVKERWWNIADIRQYIDSINKGIIPSEREQIDERTRYNDIITTALRTVEGISLDMLPVDQQSYLLQQAQPIINRKLLALTGKNLHLVRQGIYVSDDIMSDLILL